MEEHSKYVFKLGFKFFLDSGQTFIQIGEKLIDTASLSPMLRGTITKALSAAGSSVGVIAPILPAAAAAYSIWRARERQANAERRADEARAQAEEAQAQAARTEETAQNLQTQLDK